MLKIWFLHHYALLDNSVSSLTINKSKSQSRIYLCRVIHRKFTGKPKWLKGCNLLSRSVSLIDELKPAQQIGVSAVDGRRRRKAQYINAQKIQ